MSAADVVLFDVSLTLTDADGRNAENIAVDSGFRDILPVLRRFHSDRFAAAWAPENTLNPSEVKRPGVPTSTIHQTRYKLRANWLKLSADGRLSMEIDGEQSRAQLVSRIRSLSTVATSVDYGMGDGVQSLFNTANILRSGDGHLPLHRADIPPNFLRTSTTWNDALKPFRAAAFAGAAVKYPRVG